MYEDGRFHWPLRVAALLTFAIFLGTAFFTGWTKQETDLPNYYTAAVLARQGQPLGKYYDWTWFARQMSSYAAEPAQHFDRVTARPGAIFSAYPVVTPAGVFYQSMGNDRYVLRWQHDNRNEELVFAGNALLPRRATLPAGRKEN